MTALDEGGSSRDRVLDGVASALEDFGYGPRSLVDVVVRSGLTKGAFYYHFDSLEHAVMVLVEEADTALEDAFERAARTEPTALGAIVGGTLAVAALVDHHTRVRMGLRLGWATRGPLESIGNVTNRWPERFASGLALAIDQGDARPDLDTVHVSETLCAITIGSAVMTSHGDDRSGAAQLVAGAWRTLLPVIVTVDDRKHWTAFVDARAHGRGV